MLGIFDGDGSISIDKNNRVSISITLNEESCNQYKNLLINNKFTGTLSVKPDKNIFRVRINGYKSAIKLYDILYSHNPKIFLSRKFNIFKQCRNKTLLKTVKP